MHLSCGAFPPSRELEQHLLNVSPIEYEYSHACDVTLQPNARQLACRSVGMTSWRSRSRGRWAQSSRSACLRGHRRSRWLPYLCAAAAIRVTRLLAAGLMRSHPLLYIAPHAPRSVYY